MSGIIRGFRKVTHCIFDMDGLLLDTERLYSDAAQLVLDQFGQEFTFEIKQEVMGLQTQQVAEFMVAAYNLPITWQDYAEQQKTHALRLMENAELMPDTERIYEEVIRQIAISYGQKYTEATRFRVLGTTDQLTAQIAITECKLPLNIDDFQKRYKAMCRQRFDSNVPLLKGAERLLRHLNAHKVPFALATSSGEEMVNLKTKNYRELFQLFHHRVCGSSDKEVKRSKPAPDIFLIAAARFPDQPMPEQCLVFEDSPNGVLAGKSAGMQTIMVPDPRLSKDRCNEATQVIASLEDFKPEEFGLPPFSS